MKSWIAAFFMIAFGVFLTWSGYRSIRLNLHRHGIPWIEAAILRRSGEEPLPKTRTDHFLGALNHWLSVIFGPVIAALGALLVADGLDLL